MKVTSYIQQSNKLLPVEVEVSLTPGLPVLQFLGRADSAIKESEARIKAALHAQGFDLPLGYQVLINLRPNHLKKTSHGLDLAVAAAILWETEQWPKPEAVHQHWKDQAPQVYGELSLTGEVLAPEDINSVETKECVITGPTDQSLAFASLRLCDLRSLESATWCGPEKPNEKPKRPPLTDLSFASDQAEVIKLVATGEHSALFAGPAGLGKTTAAKQVYSLLRAPSEEVWSTLLKNNRNKSHNPEFNFWRPLRSPHHSTPPVSMIGGGLPLRPGEVSRAHGGVLLLDEMLEFQSSVLDALREPIESRHITVARGDSWQTFPADFLLLATTNLCPCGGYLPKPPHRCRCGITKRRNYLQRLSGPMLDRFQILALIRKPKKDDQSQALSAIFKEVSEAIEFASVSRNQKKPNRDLNMAEIESFEDPFLLKNLLPELGQSRRRHLALLQVARTFSDLEASEKIRPRHITSSSRYTLENFLDLESG